VTLPSQAPNTLRTDRDPLDSGRQATALARVSRRLIPFLFLLYILNFLDRVNVGFAALEMNRDLDFGPEVYGLGAGIFFIGYCRAACPKAARSEAVGLWAGKKCAPAPITR
jgi:ACS family tartrate transporter-like MFS transporter